MPVTITEKQADMIQAAINDARILRERAAEQLPSQRKAIHAGIANLNEIEGMIASWYFCKHCGAADVSESDVGMAWAHGEDGKLVCPPCQDEHGPEDKKDEPCCEVCGEPASKVGELSHREPHAALACGKCNKIMVSISGGDGVPIVITGLKSADRKRVSELAVGGMIKVDHGAFGVITVVRLLDGWLRLLDG